MMYSDFILDYSKLKKFTGKLENATIVEEGKNLSCGDELTLYLKVEDNVVKEAKFEGHGCAISQASTNVMIEMITGKTVEEALEIMKNAENMILGKNFDDGKLGLILNFYEVKNFPMRVKCFLLPWKTLEIALKK